VPCAIVVFALVSFSLLIPPPIAASSDAASERVPFWRAVELSGEDLGCLRGEASERLTVIACREICAPIPWQLDERDSNGDLALDQGPEPNADDPPGVIDDNDALLFMAGDAGRRRAARGELPATSCAMEVRVAIRDFEAWAYALVLPGRAAVPAPYVRYDAAADVVEAPRFTVGFRGPTPQYFALRSGGKLGRNLLDRLKVRAFARFFGLVPIWRDEDDLQTEFVAWRAGPIRVVRRQRQWVRLGWGLRTPIFRNDAFVYRDYSELPVRLRLNFPPTYFFSAIEIAGILDFRDLAGWRLIAPGFHTPARIGALDDATKRKLNELSGDWFALAGDDATLVQTLGVSPSLSSVARHLVYREDAAGQGPESVRGESPAVGVRLTRWEDVPGGAHSFASTSYTLPAGYDVERFLAFDRAPMAIESRSLPDAAPD
jgi:hypothetical protein